MMSLKQEALEMHKVNKGKLMVKTKVAVENEHLIHQG